MTIEYKTKGVTLNVDELREIHLYYEAAMTAEYICENYGVDEGRAMEIGYEIRRLMNKYNYNENEAIYILRDKLKF